MTDVAEALQPTGAAGFAVRCHTAGGGAAPRRPAVRPGRVRGQRRRDRPGGGQGLRRRRRCAAGLPAGGHPARRGDRALAGGGGPGQPVGGVRMVPYQRWWLDRMSATRFPLEEKLTLYWHNHFATGFSKVRRPKAMVAQNRLLRDHAGGNFRALCNAITGDAAMLIWLDGNTNQKIQPNENYGREFMELFTLGRDRYTQDDVSQAARAFTGYTTDGQGKALVPQGTPRRRREDDPRPDRHVGADRRHRHRPRPPPRRAGGGPLRRRRPGGVPLQARPGARGRRRHGRRLRRLATTTSRPWSRPCCCGRSSPTGPGSPSSRRPSTSPARCASST